jgi:pimeloyl-ACP methyl ester carboxylesterase
MSIRARGYDRAVRVEPFAIHVADDELDDLRARIRRTRWPDPAPGPAWSQGTDLEYVRDLLAYWADGFDWPARERELNRYQHRIADVRGEPVHFVHHRAAGGGRAALILTHGWPSTFLEMLPLADRLAGTYDLVVPSLPGYAYSPRPPHVGVDRAYVAAQWHCLMQGLGYDRYGAHGGDFGAGVTTHMALSQPDRLIGIHLSTPEMAPYSGPDSPPLTGAERAYLAQVARWDATERGYSAVQSTRPQTLGYGLTDSPAALAAWVLEKWRLWADTGGDLDARFGRDALLTMLTVMWTTRSLASSIRDYYDNRWHGTAIGRDDFVRVPTAMAVFDHAFVREGEVPRSWYERLYAIRRWTVFPRGGHFAAAEEPDLLADDLRTFFDDLR